LACFPNFENFPAKTDGETILAGNEIGSPNRGVQAGCGGAERSPDVCWQIGGAGLSWEKFQGFELFREPVGGSFFSFFFR